MPDTAPQEAVDAWNRAHSVGGWVQVRRDDGGSFVSRTTREARLLGDQPVVSVRPPNGSTAGVWALERVEALATEGETVVRLLGLAAALHQAAAGYRGHARKITRAAGGGEDGPDAERLHWRAGVLEDVAKAVLGAAGK